MESIFVYLEGGSAFDWWNFGNREGSALLLWYLCYNLKYGSMNPGNYDGIYVYVGEASSQLTTLSDDLN